MTPTFDWTQLNQLAGGDTAFELELLQLFLAEAESNLQQLSFAIASRDTHSVENIAHYLKGASANVGAVNFSQTAAQMEQLAKRGQIQQTPRLFNQLQSSYQDVRRAALSRRR
jgi:HPt (histidine-containing phosphotransfer) domain-containing protein